MSSWRGWNRFLRGEKPQKALEQDSPSEKRLEDDKTQVRTDRRYRHHSEKANVWKGDWDSVILVGINGGEEIQEYGVGTICRNW